IRGRLFKIAIIFRFKQLFVFLLFSSIFLLISASLPFVSNGSDATVGQFPSQVTVRNLFKGHPDNNYVICGGAIITAEKILSAAHCFKTKNVITRPKYLQVVVGSTDLWEARDELRYRIQKLFVHPQYTEVPSYFDLAVLIVERKIEFISHFVEPINLPTTNHIFVPRENVTIVGWGKVHPNRRLSSKLQFAVVQVQSYESCLHVLHPNPELMICAGSKGTQSTKGDSGGPLIHNNSLVAVVSFGASDPSSYYPSTYIKVYPAKKWIKNPKETFYVRSWLNIYVGFMISLILYSCLIIGIFIVRRDFSLYASLAYSINFDVH
ncbi:trypsin-like, partial [Hermetia illucens]|uniref:trypsin-like n=1 Tax=Hermetia illucens TaxID=343691 RepID=UPI0018CC5C64